MSDTIVKWIWRAIGGIVIAAMLAGAVWLVSPVADVLARVLAASALVVGAWAVLREVLQAAAHETVAAAERPRGASVNGRLVEWPRR